MRCPGLCRTGPPALLNRRGNFSGARGTRMRADRWVFLRPWLGAAIVCVSLVGCTCFLFYLFGRVHELSGSRYGVSAA